MANMLYNGIELPDIDTVWTNKTTYPYAFIHAHASAYTLYICADAPTTGTSTNYGDLCYVGAPSMTFVISNDAWKASGSSMYNTSVYYLNDYAIIWSNSDIINPDGTVYLTASEPISPGETAYAGMDIKRAEIFMLGQQLRSSLFGLMSKRIIGYSYNGTIAPKLSEWNTSYPYAIMYLDSDGAVTVRINQWLPSYMNISAGWVPCVIVQPGNSYVYIQTKLIDGKWTPLEYIRVDCTTATKKTYLYMPNIIWSNFDIYGSDVEVQFAASTPIPVYE